MVVSQCSVVYFLLGGLCLVVSMYSQCMLSCAQFGTFNAAGSSADLTQSVEVYNTYRGAVVSNSFICDLWNMNIMMYCKVAQTQRILTHETWHEEPAMDRATDKPTSPVVL